jgi:hypothetical protein
VRIADQTSVKTTKVKVRLEMKKEKGKRHMYKVDRKVGTLESPWAAVLELCQTLVGFSGCQICICASLTIYYS